MGDALQGLPKKIKKLQDILKSLDLAAEKYEKKDFILTETLLKLSEKRKQETTKLEEGLCCVLVCLDSWHRDYRTQEEKMLPIKIFDEDHRLSDIDIPGFESNIITEGPKNSSDVERLHAVFLALCVVIFEIKLNGDII